MKKYYLLLGIFIFILVFLLIIIIYIYSISKREQFSSESLNLIFSNQFPKNNEKKLLCIYTQFKNENHIMLEWIKHYFLEGADHIILVDNDSNDGFHESKIRNIPNLSLFSCKLRHKQTIIAQYIFDKYIEKSFQWVIHLDMDEFLYARKYPSISDYLRQMNSTTKAIVIPWKCFGSNGHKDQPPNVIDNFLKRSDLTKKSLVKTMIQPKYFKVLAHMAEPKIKDYDKEPYTIFMGWKSPKKYSMFYEYNPEDVDFESADLHLNHYYIQSLHFWTEIKMKRGDADNPGWDNLRSLQDFEKNDINIVFDNELAIKKKLKKPDFLIINYTLNDKDTIFRDLDKKYSRFVNKWFYEEKKNENVNDSLHNVPFHNYLSNKILMVLCCSKDDFIDKECPFIDFILCRVLQTGRAIIMKHLEGFDEPSKYCLSLSPDNHAIEVYYDKKTWLDEM